MSELAQKSRTELRSALFLPPCGSDLGMKVMRYVVLYFLTATRVSEVVFIWGYKITQNTFLKKDGALSWEFIMKSTQNNTKMNVLLNCY